MSVSILLDLQDGTSADLGSIGSTATRGFYAYGVDGRDELAIAQIYNALRARGLFYGSQFPGISNLGLTRLVYDALGAGQFRGRAIYELVTAGAFSANSAILIEDGSVLQPYETRLMPGTREPIVVSYDVQLPGASKTAKDTFDAKVPQDYVAMRLLRPCRTIRVTTTQFKKPDLDTADAVGYVNQDFWCGKKPGYWLLTEGRTTLSVYENWYVVSATAYTKTIEDWAEFGVLQQQQTGRFVPLDAAYVQRVASNPYQPSKVIPHNGWVTVCPYPATSFRSIFGFSVRP